MHYTLHLTGRCNMRCSYCYVAPNAQTMTRDTARAAVDLALANGDRRLGLIFFGGEPLLCCGLIEETVAYARARESENARFFFKITTNGLLLDEDFLDFADRESVYIALSLDGTRDAHDAHRVDADGRPTHARVAEAARRLLRRRPYAPALMTVNPDTAPTYAESVESLFSLGFQYMICSLNYGVPWPRESLRELKRQYETLADFYLRHTLAEDKFYLSPFEVKISSHVHNRTYCHERCELGQRQLSVGPDGTLYPCVQFVGDGDYALGSVFGGVDETRRQALYERNEAEKSGCGACAIRARCNHYCACLNRQATGRIDEVSPVQCAHERMLLPIADRVAAALYKKRSGLFIQKHYNDLYPLISLAEDRG